MGEHRFGADEGWRTIRLDHIRTEMDRLIARIVSNTVRRSVPRREKTKLLNRLGEIYLSEGVEPGRIAHKIAEETGMSYRWVMKYLPDRFKDSAQSERAGTAIRRVAGIGKLLDPPEDVLTIKTYVNTDFVSIVVKKPLYKRLEEEAKRLETKPDLLIYNALLLMLEKLKRGKSAQTRRQHAIGGRLARLEPKFPLHLVAQKQAHTRVAPATPRRRSAARDDPNQHLLQHQRRIMGFVAVA